MHVSLTARQVDRLTAPATGSVYYRDAGLAGFGVKVTSQGVRSYFVEARVRGKSRTRRKVLGRHPSLPFSEAKSKALNYLSLFENGSDPVADDKTVESDDFNPTLARVRDDYLSSKDLKESTRNDYRKVLKWGAQDWLGLPLVEIDRDMIANRHHDLGDKSKAQANYLMRVMRALFNFAIERYRGPKGKQIIKDNPVLLLSRVKAWHRVSRRRTVIKRHELPAWYNAVQSLKGERRGGNADVARDYLMFLLLTGARKTEGARLHRDNIDLQDRSFTLVETKNWDEHALPMSEPVWEILSRRMDMGHEWAFPSPEDGPVGDCRHWVQKVGEESDVVFTLHDLRRTFTSIAESIDLSGYTLKRLLNHKITENDVTAGYIVTDIERLRPPMEKVGNRIMELAHG